ncbi:MAG: 1-acyl-sn-glycerol-3-phosphate acyltransferase [Treponema sp.]|nr:1-acyl-sn-glycerol-3-phosphate acyltransferase [Treponema sp.]
MFPPDLPPITNKPLYVYRVLAKWFSFFYFGLSTIILITLVFPIMCLFFHPRERFKKYGRRLVSSSMGFFVSLMHFLGIVDMETDDRENFRNLSSKIIVANHPSLLDVVMLLSLIPNADCIVNAHLKRNIIVREVIRRLYIPGSPDFEDILRSCTESLNQGNCLIIFPEGTRTPRSGNVVVKRGAARIALVSNCNIVPVHIGGTDKYGLGKKDPWTGFNPRERYVYNINMGAEIKSEKFRNLNLSMPKAVRVLTREIADSIFPKGNYA